MNTAENNKLIAEFMGYTQPHPDYPNATYWYKENSEPLTILLYNYSWDWLMQVVEKIESIVWEDLNDTSFDVTIGATSYCIIQDNNGGVVEIIGDGKTKIEAVYNAVTDFIKWYNKQYNI